MRRTLMTLWLALLPMAVSAQNVSPAGDVAAELAKVNATLKEIVALLSRQSDLQSVDLLMKRVQLADGQAADLERRRRSTQDELRGLESERNNVEMRLKMFGSRAEHADAEKVEGSLAIMTEQAERDLKRIRQRIGQLAPEIAALEGDLATRREELRSWQQDLDRRLARSGG